METVDKVIELKALESEYTDRNVEVLQYAFLVVMDTKEYQSGTVTRRMELLNSAFTKINTLVLAK